MLAIYASMAGSANIAWRKCGRTFQAIKKEVMSKISKKAKNAISELAKKFNIPTQKSVDILITDESLLKAKKWIEAMEDRLKKA